jgi:hypothetical protein
MNWLEPWYGCENEASAASFEAELRRELSPAHPLYSVPVELLGRRDNRDDFLFGFRDGTGRVAEVHLTFRGAEEPLPWPATRVYESLAEWELRCMVRDHAEWEHENLDDR